MGVFSDLASYSVQVVHDSLHSPDNTAIKLADKTETFHRVNDPKITWSDKVKTNFCSHITSKYFYIKVFYLILIKYITFVEMYCRK